MSRWQAACANACKGRCAKSRTNCSTWDRISVSLEEDKARYAPPQIEQRHVDRLEALLDELTPVVGALENFILPGGSLGASHLHVARTVCRRAEREATSLANEETINRLAIRYLNRLSDALFVMARFENHQRGVAEPLWDPAA